MTDATQRKAIRLSGSITCGLALLLVAVPASAGDVSPGAVKETVKPAPAQPGRPAAGAEVETQKPAAAAVPAGGPAIQVNRFEIIGNSAITTDELRQALAGSEGKKLTLAEIYAVADRLTGLYHQRGYTLASVTVPAQQVSSGVIKLEVIEGRLGKVSVTGNRRYRSEVILDRMDRMTPGAALTLKDLELDLIEANRLPGLSARATVKPGDQYGTSDVLVKAEERLFDASVTLDNKGRESLGDWRASARGAIYNPFNIGDRLDLNVLHAQSGLLEYGGFNYDMPVGPWDTHAGVYYSHYDYDVDTKELNLAALTMFGRGTNFGLRFTHPFLRTANQEITGGIGIDRTLTTQDGSTGEIDHDITLMRLSGTWSRQHADNAISNVAVEFSSNFRHNEETLQFDGQHHQKGKFRVDAVHLRPLFYSWSMLLRGSGVLSFDPLVDTERFRIGGEGSVRAFPAAEFAGDQGIAGTIEFRRPLGWIPSVPLQFSTFYDAAIVHQKKTNPGEHKTESLTGVGVGLSTLLAKRYTIEVQVAQPTTAHDGFDGRETRLWFAFGANF